MVTGKDLIRLGYDPAKWFGSALFMFNSVRKVWSDEEIIKHCDTLLPEPVLELSERK